jgi:hypothetical protein
VPVGIKAMITMRGAAGTRVLAPVEAVPTAAVVMVRQ